MGLAYFLYIATLRTGSARISMLNCTTSLSFIVGVLVWCAYGILAKGGAVAEQIAIFWAAIIFTGAATIFAGYRRYLSRMENDPPPGRYDYERGLFDPWIMSTPKNRIGAIFTRHFWSIAALAIGTGVWFPLHLSKTGPHKTDIYAILGTFLITLMIGYAIGAGIAGIRLIRHWERKTGRLMRLASFADAR